MSDCFDHAVEAFESQYWGNSDFTSPSSSYFEDNSSNFKKDKNYYHRKIKAKVAFETEKAYLLENKKGKFWVAKKLCRKVRDNSLLIHKSAQLNYLHK